MTPRNTKLALTLSAAAVALALGTGPTLAQQEGGAPGSQQQTAPPAQSGSQQQQQEQGGQSAQQDREFGAQQGASQPGQPASNQQSAGADELNRIAETHSDLSTFVQALQQAGLVDSLASDTHYTVFAPTNEAFESMQQDVAELMQPDNREQLVSLLRAHIVADDLDPERARQLTAAQTLDGGTIELSAEEDKLMVGGASVVAPDIEVQGANLRIYSIDQVLDRDQQSAAASDGRSRG